MAGWRGAWALAQITGVVVSTCVWAMMVALWPVAAAAAFMAGAAYVIGRSSALSLWWKFGVRRAQAGEHDRLLATLLPIVALRGRRHPTIWIGRHGAAHSVIMAGARNLIVGDSVLHRLMGGDLDSRQMSALVCQALGQQVFRSSALVAAVDAYCLPWSIVALASKEACRLLGRVPLLSFAWRIRWLTFGLALFDSARNGRWAGFAGVALIAIMTWSTGYLQGRWHTTMLRLSDRRVVAEGYGLVLAGLLRRAPVRAQDAERIHALANGAVR